MSHLVARFLLALNNKKVIALWQKKKRKRKT